MVKFRACQCGSGRIRYLLNDARNIPIGYVCEACEPAKRAQYRPEIFTNPNYWTDEPVDEEL